MTPDEVSEITFKQFWQSIYIQTALKVAPALLVGMFGVFGGVWWFVAGNTNKQLAETKMQVQQLVLAQTDTAKTLTDLKQSTDDAFKGTQGQIADLQVDTRVIRGILQDMQKSSVTLLGQIGPSQPQSAPRH